MALMREAGCQRDLRDGELALHEQGFRAFEAALNDVLVHGQAGGLAEERFGVRGADAGDGRELRERHVFGQVIFDVGEGLLEPASTEAAALFRRALRHGAVGRDQTGGDGDGKAVHVEAARGIVGFHLGLQRPTDVLQLDVAYLKAISDLHAA